MKRLFAFLLIFCLILGAVPLAYAEDGGDDVAEGTVEADGGGGKSPAPEEVPVPEKKRVVVRAYEELIEEIEKAEDEATIYLQYSIWMSGDEEYVIGAEDKNITLSPSDDYSEECLFCVFGDTKVTFENVVIQGTIDTTLNQDNVIRVEDQNSEVHLENVTIRNFVCERAAVLNRGKIYISNCNFENIQSSVSNSPFATYGIIYTDGTAIIDRSSFSKCSCTDTGSIINNYDTIGISNSELYDNETRTGGTVFSGQYTKCEIDNTSIINNTAPVSFGAGVYTTYGCELSLVDCQIYGNSNHYSFTSDIYCTYGRISISYTKPLAEIYEVEDRIPYGWTLSDGSGVSVPEKLDLPYQPDDSLSVQLRFFFEDELPESEDPDPANPPPEPEDNGQEQPPTGENDSQGDDDIGNGTDRPQELPAGGNDDQDPPTDGNDGQQPPTGDGDGQEPPQEPADGQDQQQPQEPANGQEQQQPQEPPTGDDHGPQEQGDKDTDAGTEQPQEPSGGSSDSGKDNGHDYTPPAHWWPSVPSTSSRSPAPKDEGKEEMPGDNIPLENTPRLVCGSAVIDSSRMIVLLGYGDGQQHRDDLLTRAQAAQIIHRLLTAESVAQLYTLYNAFEDVPADAWYAEAVSTIANAGVVVGYGNGLFCPNDNLTWAQALTILSRFVEPKKYELQYISYEGWALDAIQTAVALGWIRDSAEIVPDALITRGQMADLVNLVIELSR